MGSGRCAGRRGLSSCSGAVSGRPRRARARLLHPGSVLGQFRTRTLPMKAKNSAYMRRSTSAAIQAKIRVSSLKHRAFWGRCGVSAAARRLAHTHTGTRTPGAAGARGKSSGGSWKGAVGSSTRTNKIKRRSSRAGASSGRRRRGGGSPSRRSPWPTPRTSGSATSSTRSRP